MSASAKAVTAADWRADFPVVFEGYAGGAEHWPLRREAWKWSLRADILRTS